MASQDESCNDQGASFAFAKLLTRENNVISSIPQSQIYQVSISSSSLFVEFDFVALILHCKSHDLD